MNRGRWLHGDPTSRPHLNAQLPTDRKASVAEERFRLGNRERAEMEDARGEDRTRVSLIEHFNQVIEGAGSSAGDHWDTHGIAHGFGQAEVVACTSTVAIHTRE